MSTNNYPIGTPGTPWGETEKQQWRAGQQIKRSYQQEVLAKLDTFPDAFDKVQYGALPYDSARYPLFAFTSRQWREDKPTVLITGGVHGYETSGVQGAILFLQQHAQTYVDSFNLIIAPCLSPWGYETINRWNPNAIDPNRSFVTDSPSAEAGALMAFVDSLNTQVQVHIDLHETTDTDNSEFRPALAARDGQPYEHWEIPDGFYVVDNKAAPQPAFQTAIIASVEQVTHIAPPDSQSCIIGSPVVQRGVIEYDKAKLGLCAGFTDAKFVCTTEVYPDSPSADPDTCNRAQVAAITGGLDYLKNQ